MALVDEVVAGLVLLLFTIGFFYLYMYYHMEEFQEIIDNIAEEEFYHDVRPITETIPVNINVETNSTLSNDNIQDKSENSKATKIDVTKTESSQNNCTNDLTNELQTCEGSIKIRLKYLNDDCHLVEGSLQENIGVFKRRHFCNELSSNKIIRLVFQGKVLRDDEVTLSNCGLYDNCVVHCLIHQQRPLTNTPQTIGTEQQIPNLIHPEQRRFEPVMLEYFFKTLLFAFITIILLILWYMRICYSTLFSTTSTVLLGFMTGIYMLVIFFFYGEDIDIELQINFF